MGFVDRSAETTTRLRRVMLDTIRLHLGRSIGRQELDSLRVSAELDHFTEAFVLRMEAILAGREVYREVERSLAIAEGPLVQFHGWCQRTLTVGRRWLPRWLGRWLRKKFLKHIRYRYEEIAIRHVRCCPHGMLEDRGEHLHYLVVVPADAAILERSEAVERLVAAVLGGIREIEGSDDPGYVAERWLWHGLRKAVQDYEAAVRGGGNRRGGGFPEAQGREKPQ